MNSAGTVAEVCTHGRRTGFARNPSVLPAAVRQCSVEIGEVSDLFDGVRLPPELARSVPRRQVQFRAGRFCASQALTSLTHRMVADVPRGNGGAPEWPAGVVGSITHTDGFASAAVGHLVEVTAVGIDTEPVMAPARARSVVSAVAWPCELAQARDAGCNREEALTLVFSAKESIFKCLFPSVGRRFGFHDVRILRVDGGTRIFAARLVTTLTGRLIAGTEVQGRFELDGRYVHTGVALPGGFEARVSRG
jgi:enterobactin synthetase component D